MNKTVPVRTDFPELAREYDLIPLVRSIPFQRLDPVALYRAVRAGEEGEGFLLESGKAGRYTYLGFGYTACIESRGGLNSLRMTGEEGNDPEPVVRPGDPFEHLRSRLGNRNVYPHPLLSGFVGGAVGYITYDAARSIERLPESAEDDLGLPDIRCIIPNAFFEIDHSEGYVHIIVPVDLTRGDHEISDRFDRAESELDRLELLLNSLLEAEHAEPSIPPTATGENGQGETTSNLSPEEFSHRVTQAIEYILAGDIFQVNLSVRFSREFSGDPLALYESLRRINPSPYMTFLECADHAVVGASPELLLKVRGTDLSTRPIAGTRKRGADDREDEEKIRELIGNEKERAEHVMLVDLERNDLGRVARYGSVHVDEFMAIEKYSHVIHIVSNVRAELAEGKDVFDAIRAAFPGGTITGAPKVRAMEIIEELEPHRRGIYTGSIGWIGYNGDAELNIAIRTMLLKGGKAYIQAGAGIVADSVPEYEYKESLRKAEAALNALRLTGEGS